MTDTSKKELMNEAFDAALVTGGAVGISIVSKKLLVEKLTDAENVKEIAKLFVGVALSTMLVKYARDKKWISDDPF